MDAVCCAYGSLTFSTKMEQSTGSGGRCLGNYLNIFRQIELCKVHISNNNDCAVMY